MSLTHKYPECTGRWGPRMMEERIYAVCEECGAIGADLVKDHEAAILVSLTDNTLDEQSKEGRELLEGP